MARRRVVVPALDVGHCTFDEFLTERLNALRADLLKECDRIAVARELNLKKEVEESHKQNKALRLQIRALSTQVANFNLPVDTDAMVKANDMKVSKVGTDTIDSDCAPALREEAEAPTKATSSGDSGELDGSKVRSLDDLEDWDVSDGMGLSLPAQCDTSLEESYVSAKHGEPSAKHHDHFVLWTEWAEEPSSHNPSLGDQMEQDDVLDSKLETEWLQKHEPDEKFNSHEHWYQEASFDCCTISPSSNAAICWELLGIPVLFYDLITIPLQVFYEMEDNASRVIAWTVIAYWTTDMLLRFLVMGFITGAGQVHLGRTEIMKHYLKTAFAFDLILVTPDWLSICLGAPRNVALLRVFRIVRLMRVLRMSKLRKISREVQDYLDSEYFSVILSIFENLIAVIGCCHYMACFWFWLGDHFKDSELTWLERYRLEDVTWEYQYARSLHWAITQFTPGSSNIQPCNTAETLVALLVLIFGMVFFSLFISSITQQRMHLKALTSKLDRESWILRRYLKQHAVSKELQIRATRYVDVCVAPLMKRVQRKDVALLEYLSHPLQLEVQAELFYHTLLHHPFLRELRDRSQALTSTLFADAVIEIALAETDLLFVVGHVSHEMYFVSRGSLAYLKHGSNEAHYIKPGEWLCEPVLWVPWVYKGMCRAPQECYIVSIDSAKVRTVVLEHKERTFVRQCAKAYLNDLNAYVDGGHELSDIICIKDDASEYMQVIHAGQRVLLKRGPSATIEMEGEMGDETGAPAGPDVSRL